MNGGDMTAQEMTKMVKNDCTIMKISLSIWFVYFKCLSLNLNSTKNGLKTSDFAKGKTIGAMDEDNQCFSMICSLLDLELSVQRHEREKHEHNFTCDFNFMMQAMQEIG